MSLLFKYLCHSFFLPLWWLQLVIPRNKKIWVFGAWYGLRYCDNSRFLFEYVHKNDPNITAVWITKNKKIKEHLNRLGYKAYMANSFKGIGYSLISKYIIVSCVKKDVNALCINGAITIQVWHGNPMKKIGMDDAYSRVNSFFYSKLVKYIYTMNYEFNYSYIVSNAPCFTKIMSSAFGTPPKRILETGSPRNDAFAVKESHDINTEFRKRFKDCKIIYYLPTFRSKTNKIQNLLDLEEYRENELQDFLEKKNLVFVTKGHFVAKTIKGDFIRNNRIINLPQNDMIDINLLLKDADILITDYSSVYFDFLLSQRPIIFAAYDLEEYLFESREMYFDYKNIIAGPIVSNWTEVYSAISVSVKETKWNKLLEEKNKVYNKYYDNQNTKRVYKEIVNL